MQLIDSHTHIDFDEFSLDREQSLQNAINVGITDIIVSSTIAQRWHLVKKVCEHSICHPAYGLHPMFMNEHDVDNDITALVTWLKNNKCVAIGEIGLDFYIEDALDESNRNAQVNLFIRQLEIANDFDLPIIIHARKSLDIILKYLRRFPKLRGSVHSFSGSQQQASQLIDLGYYLSFGGPITYDRATKLHKIIKNTPLNSILVETDSPDQPDAIHHSQRNEPAFILNVVNKIAELKNTDVDTIAKHTSKNAMSLYRLGSV